MGAQRAGRRSDGARLHQVGRPADLTAALCRIGNARLQDRDDATDDAGAARRRWRSPGGSDLARGQLTPAHSETDSGDAAAGRLGCGRRSGTFARQRPEPDHRRRSRSADAGRDHPSHRARRGTSGAGRESGWAHEFPLAPSAESDQQLASAHCRR